MDIAILMKTKSSALTLTSTDDFGFVNCEIVQYRCTICINQSIWDIQACFFFDLVLVTQGYQEKYLPTTSFLFTWHLAHTKEIQMKFGSNVFFVFLSSGEELLGLVMSVGLSVRRSVSPSVGRSVRRSVGRSVGRSLENFDISDIKVS